MTQPIASRILCYQKLQDVLNRAYEQAACGKGMDRHANFNEPFEDQQILEITRRIGMGYPLGQAVKKIYESERLPVDEAIDELLGAINYIAAGVIRIEEMSQ